jgi:hypothetical protein
MTSTPQNLDLPVPAGRGTFERGGTGCAFTALTISCCAKVLAQVPVDNGPAAQPKTLTTGAVVSDVLPINPFASEGLEASDIGALQATGVERFCDRSDGLNSLIEDGSCTARHQSRSLRPTGRP